MEVKFDKTACTGWFQCIQEWDAFDMEPTSGKAKLENAENVGDNTFVREVPDKFEEEALAAAETCPADAIKIYEAGEQIAPEK
jgi:ferredoxin